MYSRRASCKTRLPARRWAGSIALGGGNLQWFSRPSIEWATSILAFWKLESFEAPEFVWLLNVVIAANRVATDAVTLQGGFCRFEAGFDSGFQTLKMRVASRLGAHSEATNISLAMV